MKNIKILGLCLSLAMTTLGFASTSPTPLTTNTQLVTMSADTNVSLGYVAQTSTPGAANPLATLNLGLSGFVQGHKTYVVVLAPLSNLYTSKTGKVSVDLQGFTGYNATNSTCILGTGVTGSYKLSTSLNAMAGLGVSVPYDKFTWSQVNRNTIGLLVGIVGKF